MFSMKREKQIYFFFQVSQFLKGVDGNFLKIESFYYHRTSSLEQIE